MTSSGLWPALASALLVGVAQDADATLKAAHPFYVSVCRIDHNPETRALEMSFRIFTDDLEQTLEALGTGSLRLGTGREAEKADLYIGRYLVRHVVFEINGKRMDADFLGKEVEEEATWCYVEITGVPELKSIAVTNTLLLETFEDQVNLVHVNAHGQKKSMLFSRLQEKDTLTF